ncbi:hypothetical protein FACS1894167_09920 [Synergistales bacterium]|nr:hypothetical protein FACS1894167_09920 [Synergistales bacterium]
MAIAAAYAAILIMLSCAVAPRGAGEWCAFCGALCSLCVLPWSGAPVLYFAGADSRAWLPLIASAIILSGLRIKDNSFLILSLTVSVSFMSFFISESGIPGDILSIEGMALLLRFAGAYNDARLVSGMYVMGAGLLLSFMSADFSRASRNLITLSLAGFWVIIFMPVDISRFFSVPQYMRIAADAIGLFCAALALSRLISGCPSLAGKVKFQIAGALIAALGGCFLMSV